MTFADNLARLRVAAAIGTVPPDLARWAVETIAAMAPFADRVEARNLLLRAAADQLSGSGWAKARRLKLEIQALSGGGISPPAADPGSRAVRRLVAQAAEVDPALPRSLRQLIRIVA